MKKNILLISMLLFTAPIVGARELFQNIVTTVPPAISIQNLLNATTATADSLTGNLSNPLSCQFRLRTNTGDSGYDYILQAKVNTQAGLQNAYTPISGGYGIILGNVNPLPTLAAINNIKTAPTTSGNPNAIAYPQDVTKTNFPSITIQNIATYGGLCYKLLVGNVQVGNIIETTSTTPVVNTYSIDDDNAGTYEVIIIIGGYQL